VATRSSAAKSSGSAFTEPTKELGHYYSAEICALRQNTGPCHALAPCGMLGHHKAVGRLVGCLYLVRIVG
jgi:hypothetical protein